MIMNGRLVVGKLGCWQLQASNKTPTKMYQDETNQFERCVKINILI